MILKRNNLSLYYETRGRGKPVLFIHGFPLTGDMWREAVDLLNGNYRCVIPDLRCHGKSDALAELEMRDFADDLHALLAAIKDSEPATIIGFSMGGYIAFEFFRQYPNSCEALVFVDTKPQADSPQKAKERHSLADRVLKEGSQLVADEMVPHMFAKESGSQLRDKWHGIMASTSPIGLAATLRAMAKRQDSLQTCKKISVPTLIIVGQEDKITPVDDARIMQEEISGSQLAIVEKAGHMTPVEQPKQFANLVEDFLADFD